MTRIDGATGAAAVLCAAMLCLAGSSARAQGIGSPVPVTDPPPSCVRIGTWNLEHLGGREPRRSDDDYRKIAAFIRRTGVAVLAVQEVGGPGPLGHLVAELNAQVAPATDPLGRPVVRAPFQFVLGTTGGFGDGSDRISVGFVWDDRLVELVQAEELLQLPRERDGMPIFHRVPVTAVFRVLTASPGGGLDFRAITVHLKASRGTANEAKRKAEVESLLAYLGELYERQGEDRDIVVLGDFNHTYGSPAYAAFTATGLVRYVRTDGDPPTIVHFAEPIDHLAVTRDGLDLELVPDSRHVRDELLRELGKEAWRATYSDHLPVTLDLVAFPDNDPEARFSPPDPGHVLLPGGRTLADAAIATAATAAPVPAPGAAFPVGCEVTVTYRRAEGELEDQERGKLLEPLGAWVVIDTGDSGVLAIPAMRVVSVHRK